LKNLLLNSRYLPDLSVTQSLVLGATSRYELLGERLADRLQMMDSTGASVRRYDEDLRELLGWVENREQAVLPLRALPANERDVRNKITAHQVCEIFTGVLVLHCCPILLFFKSDWVGFICSYLQG